jgi:hypothetical protein
MPTKKSRLECLRARRELLLAESEVNRAQLQIEIATLREEFADLAQQAMSVGTVASRATLALGGFKALRFLWNFRRRTQRSMLSTVLNLAGTAASLWMAFRRPAKSESEESEADKT